MKSLYASLLLWLIRPALEKHQAEVLLPKIKIDRDADHAAILDGLERSGAFSCCER